MAVLDPRITYEGLKLDFAKDLELLADFEMSKELLEKHYDKNYSMLHPFHVPKLLTTLTQYIPSLQTLHHDIHLSILKLLMSLKNISRLSTTTSRNATHLDGEGASRRIGQTSTALHAMFFVFQVYNISAFKLNLILLCLL